MTVKALRTIKKIQIIDKKKVAKATRDLNKKDFIVYLTTIISKIAIYLAANLGSLC